MGKFDRKLADPNNEIRMAAESMISALWEAGSTNQLKLLKMQIDQSLARPFSSFTGRSTSIGDDHENY